ncbi:hypothetical protein R1sor_010837 [Riccia sorocarpa]|uniref:Aldehyde dehydrogenase domain-containing protein n=1 Tax=Riccia sorocarpa TaxID=122646 RepID=A0ABD3I3A2_9MARC
MDPWQMILALGAVFAIWRLILWLLPEPIPALNVDASDVLSVESKQNEENSSFVPGSGSGSQADRVPCYDPATMKYLGSIPVTEPNEVREIVKRAREAQKVWGRSGFNQRRLLLRVLLKYTLEHQELICRVSAKDSGKTMLDATFGEILTTCEKISYLLKEGERVLRPQYRSTGMLMIHKSARVEYHPLGVIGAIVPWNYPFHNIFNPMLAAVFSGNAVVIKVSEHASWSSFFYLRIIQAALKAVGAPADLVHVITGYAETGSALVSSVDKVIFVGSTTVGRKVMETAAKTLTPVTLELGGKDPVIVCEDADLSQVIHMAVRATLQSAGQNCAGAERFYVHESIHDQFVKEIAKIVKSVRVGPPLEKHCDVGAICMPDHAEKLEMLVTDAVQNGAEVVARGTIVSAGFGTGQFFPPTVLINVNHSMRLMQEEIFGPILNIMKFKTDEEAVKLANDSSFGLGSSVFSGSKKRANAIASKLYCGMASINDFGTNYLCQSLPFGGVKESGFGRFAGEEGLRALCVVKAVCEDRIPFVKTSVPKPLQYPVADNAFQFQESLIRMLYGLSWTAKLNGLVDLVKSMSSKKVAGQEHSNGKVE